MTRLFINKWPVAARWFLILFIVRVLTPVYVLMRSLDKPHSMRTDMFMIVQRKSSDTHCPGWRAFWGPSLSSAPSPNRRNGLLNIYVRPHDSKILGWPKNFVLFLKLFYLGRPKIFSRDTITDFDNNTKNTISWFYLRQRSEYRSVPFHVKPADLFAM